MVGMTYMENRFLLKQQSPIAELKKIGKYKIVRKNVNTILPNTWYTKKTRGNNVFYLLDVDAVIAEQEQVLLPLEPGKRLFASVCTHGDAKKAIEDYISRPLPKEHAEALDFYAQYVEDDEPRVDVKTSTLAEATLKFCYMRAALPCADPPARLFVGDLTEEDACPEAIVDMLHKELRLFDFLKLGA